MDRPLCSALMLPPPPLCAHLRMCAHMGAAEAMRNFFPQTVRCAFVV